MSISSIIEFKRNSLSEKILSKSINLEIATKRLKIQKVGKESEKRKLVISTNLLNLFGFTENTQVNESLISADGPAGMKITLDKEGSKKVYGRNYANRERETQMDIRHQSKLDQAFSGASHVHIIFKQGELTLTPVFQVSSAVVAEGINFNLIPNEGVYHGIVDALNIIRQKAFESITIDSPPDFIGSQEHTLFCLQLRRMGYDLNQYESGVIHARLTGQPYFETHQVDLKDIKPLIKDVEFSKDDPYSTFVACTGGVDIACLESAGFSVKSALDWTPPESRDFKKTQLNDGSILIKHNDKTEFGAISAAINAKSLRALLNEDLYLFEFNRIKANLAKCNFLHISLQCCDFSALKGKSERAKAIVNMSSTRDMIFPAIKLIEDSNIPTILFENVKNFATSIECEILEVRLSKIGYKIHKKVLSAYEYNGYSSRSRCYLFATKLDADFFYPKIEERHVHAWNDIFKGNESELRDVTHTSSVAKGIKGGRIRPFTASDDLAPTVTRSQSRQCKDSLYANIGGRYFMPSLSLLRGLLSIPNNFDLSLFSGEVGTELVGQSICFSMHEKLVKCIKHHINAFMSGVSKIEYPIDNTRVTEISILKPESQMVLF